MSDTAQSTQSKGVLFYSAAGVASALCLYAALGRELWVILDVLICTVILYAAAIASGKNPL